MTTTKSPAYSALIAARLAAARKQSSEAASIIEQVGRTKLAEQLVSQVADFTDARDRWLEQLEQPELVELVETMLAVCMDEIA